MLRVLAASPAIEVTRRDTLDDVAASGGSALLATLSAEERRVVNGWFVSAFVRAHKPGQPGQ